MNQHIGESLANGLINQSIRQQNLSADIAIQRLRADRGKYSLNHHWRQLLEFTFKAYEDRIISQTSGGTKKDRFHRFLCSALTDCGGLEFFVINLSVRETILKNKRPELKVLKAWVSRHAVQRLIQSTKQTAPNHLGNVLFDHALEVSGSDCQMTADEQGLALWSQDRDNHELSVCTTYIRADQLDQWQRDYDRLKSGLPVPGAVWVGRQTF
jgi:hypothetical protein